MRGGRKGHPAQNGPRPVAIWLLAPTPKSVARSAARFAPGRILASRYRIVSLLGRGAMGEVYRADDLRLGQSVALKLMSEASRAGTTACNG